MSAKNFSPVIACALTLCLTTGVSGVVNIDMTFSTGATPTDFGMQPTSSADSGVDTTTGTWNGQGLWWMRGFSATTLPTENFSQDIIHGFAEITHSGFGSYTDGTMFRFVDNSGSPGTNRNYSFELNVAEDSVRVHPSSIINLGDTAQTNNDSQKHTYGWELNRATNVLKVYFDGLQIGDASYTVPNGAEVQAYIGDGNGGAVAGHTYDRWVVREGAFVIPEPTTLGLLVPAVCILFARRRRSRLHTG